MINVFKAHAPAYKRLVRKYALDIWKERLGKKEREEFYWRVERYKRNYERDLVDYYREKDIRIFPGTIREKSNQWYESQAATLASLETIAQAKKSELSSDLFEKLRQEKAADVQKVLSKVYLSPADLARGAEVYKVFSFSDNFEAKAEQIGEEQAFDLGKDINHAVMKKIGDGYKWETQQDSRVRKTHRKLGKKNFLYSDPPTTIDKYGNIHTGHPGTAYGCRCWEDEMEGKPFKAYIARE